MFRNLILFQAVTLALGWRYGRILLALCRRQGGTEVTLLWVQVPAGALTLLSARIVFRLRGTAPAIPVLTH